MNRKSSVVVLASTCFCVAAHAATITWSGAANDGNKWSTRGNWIGDSAPTAADTAEFANTTDALTVDVDTGNCTCLDVSIAAGAKSVTFSGSGTLTIAMGSTAKSAARTNSPLKNNNFQSHATTFDCNVVLSGGDRVILLSSLVFAGDLSIPNSTYVWLGADKNAPVEIDGHAGIIVRGGLSCNSSATVYNNIGAGRYLVFDVAAGKTAVVPAFNCNADCGVLFKSGRIEVGNASFTAGRLIDYRIDGADVLQTYTGSGNNESLATNGFAFASGRLTLGKTSHVARPDSALSLMGFDGGVLSAAKRFCHGVAGSLTLPLGSNATLTIDGTFSHTNSATCTTTIPAGLSLSGAGVFNARHLTVSTGFRADGVRLNLGDSFNGSSDGYAVVLSNATLGCWADWRSGTVKTGTYNLWGRTILDTEDVNSGIGRNIYLEKVAAGDDLVLSVEGSGVAALNWKNGTASPVGVSVGDGATLVLSNMTALAAKDFTFGAESLVELNAGEVVFPEGASISLTPAARQALKSGGAVLRVLFAPTITDLANVSSEYAIRSVAVDGGYELRIGSKNGMAIIVR